jgi:uncharacterized membrane protein YfcA
MLIAILLVTVLNIVASVLSGFTGFGMSSIVTPFLVDFFPAAETFMFTGLMHTIGSLWIILLFRRNLNVRLLLAFGIPGVIGSFLGSQISLALPRLLLIRSMGIFLVAYVILVRWYARYHFPAEMKFAILGGSLAGFFAGVFGFSGAIRALFLSSFALPKEEYILTSHLLELGIDVTRAGSYLAHGVVLGPVLYWSLLLAPLTLVIGAYCARMLVQHVSSHQFENIITWALFIEGVRFMVFPS